MVEDYNQLMGYFDKGERMANSYSISQRLRKLTQKCFHLFDQGILKRYSILSSCSSQIDHEKFNLFLVQKVMEMITR